MGKFFKKEETEKLFRELKKSYDLYAPKLFKGEGCYSDTDVVRYGLIDKWEEIVWDKKSDYSFKEILFPVSETLFYFTEEEMKVPEGKEKASLIFLRSCDMHALKRLDEIYLKNGREDFYYRRLRERTDFALMGCSESFESCFCAGMGTNRCDFYDMYINPKEDGCYVQAVKENLGRLIEDMGEKKEEPVAWVTENKVSVKIPEQLPAGIQNDGLWETYGGRCIGCGRCNFVCPACTCFTMQDIFYKENPKTGERRRVWASCQVDGYTDGAGGLSFRKNQGERLRFKVLHKIHDYKKRFGYHMCIGCGRCEDICPEYISYIGCLQKLKEMEEA